MVDGKKPNGWCMSKPYPMVLVVLQVVVVEVAVAAAVDILSPCQLTKSIQTIFLPDGIRGVSEQYTYGLPWKLC